MELINYAVVGTLLIEPDCQSIDLGYVVLKELQELIGFRGPQPAARNIQPENEISIQFFQKRLG